MSSNRDRFQKIALGLPPQDQADLLVELIDEMVARAPMEDEEVLAEVEVIRGVVEGSRVLADLGFGRSRLDAVALRYKPSPGIPYVPLQVRDVVWTLLLALTDLRGGLEAHRVEGDTDSAQEMLWYALDKVAYTAAGCEGSYTDTVEIDLRYAVDYDYGRYFARAVAYATGEQDDPANALADWQRVEDDEDW